MDVEALRKILAERIRIMEETQDEWDYGIEMCWQKETDLLSQNVADTKQFIEDECTDDELWLLSEIFEEVAAKTQSLELLDCIRKRSALMTDAEQMRSVQAEIEFADGQINY